MQLDWLTGGAPKVECEVEHGVVLQIRADSGPVGTYEYSKIT